MKKSAERIFESDSSDKIGHVFYFHDDKKLWLRWPGVEPGSTAWKAAMLTAIPPTLDEILHA